MTKPVKSISGVLAGSLTYSLQSSLLKAILAFSSADSFELSSLFAQMLDECRVSNLTNSQSAGCTYTAPVWCSSPRQKLHSDGFCPAYLYTDRAGSPGKWPGPYSCHEWFHQTSDCRGCPTLRLHSDSNFVCLHANQTGSQVLVMWFYHTHASLSHAETSF